MASLKYIADSSLQTVTLGSAYTAGDGSMTLTAGQGARLPSSGDFWMVYNDGAGTIRIFKVTARSTDTLTVTADATEGSGDGNISSGETLRWGLTVAALTQLRQDLSGYGTYASLPATCTVGDTYVTSNSIYTFVATATNTWTPFYRGREVTIPVDGDFAWINQGSATVTSTSGNIILYAPAGASNSCRIRKKTAPATPYTIEAGFEVFYGSGNFAEAGLVFRQSSDGKLSNFYTIQPGQSMGVSKWTNETTFSAGYTLSPAPPGAIGQVIWMQITDNGTNRVCTWSPDGINWIDVHTVTRTDFLTADEVGFYANMSNSLPIYMNLFHWKQS